MAPSVFLGLVTHETSRFPQARGPKGLLATTKHVLLERGIEVHSEVHSANHFPELDLHITAADIRASIAAELGVEKKWHHYLQPTRNQIPTAIRLTAWRWYRTYRESLGSSRGANVSHGRVATERLINIELAHLHLMREAIKSQAGWSLILEDDATSADPESFADDLANFVTKNSEVAQPLYINISRSFEAKNLKISHLLRPIGAWNSDVSIFESSLPVSNTVCAVLYEKYFLDHLFNQLRDIPIQPVLPIDWKVNLALMEMHQSGILGHRKCWILDPAPVTQGSMHG